MMGKPTKRQLMAGHEAGHAVIARKLGITVTFVAMFPVDERTAAGVQNESAGHKNGNEHGFGADAKVALAGPAAQARAFPGSIKEKNISDDKMRAPSEALRSAPIMADFPAAAPTPR